MRAPAQPRRLTRISAAAILGACLLCVAAPAAPAADRFASPTGGTTEPCNPAPCDVKTAIQNAPSGDDAFVPGNLGDYAGLTSIQPPAAGVHVHGTNGRPRLIFASGGMRLKGASTAENLYVEAPGPATAFAFDLPSGGNGANLIVKLTGVGNACFLEGATLTNSVCWAGQQGTLAVETDGSNTFRNDTFFGGTDAALKAFGRDPSTLGRDDLVNVIARSAAGGVDLKVESRDSKDAAINATYSNYSTTAKVGPAALTHVNGDATDQNLAPLFVAAGSGNFHQATGSPTVDQGLNDAANGASDFDGDARILNGRTDIGADECVTACLAAGGGGGNAVTADLSKFAINPRAFLAASKGPSVQSTKRKKRKKKPGAIVSFQLNEAASVSFKVTQRQRGRKNKRGRCVKRTRTNRKRKKCTQTVTLRGGFTVTGKAGSNSFRFTGRLRGRKLKPGRYVLVGTPTANGVTGKPRTISFKIKRPARRKRR